MNRLTGRGVMETIDWRLVICYLLLILIGWMNIYASIHSTEPASIFDFSCRSGKQFVWIVSSLGLAAIILFALNPRIYESLSVPIYGFTILLLIAVIFLGTEVKGSRSWFSFGPVSFQPAELSKIATSLMLATVMSQSGFRMSNMKHFLATAAVIIVPMAIIVAQSETGSALVYVGFVFMLYREGLSGWLLFIIGMAILLFILTLTSSAYTSILVLAIVTTLCSAMYYDRIKSWLKIYLPSFIVLGLLPFLHDKLSGLTDNPEAFILKVKPMYIFAAAAAVSIPIMAFKAFRSGGAFR